MRRAVVIATSATAMLAGSPAWALCPNCIAQSPSSTLRLVGLFLLVPPAVFFAVAIAVRRICARYGPPSPPSAPASGSGGGVQGD